MRGRYRVFPIHADHRRSVYLALAPFPICGGLEQGGILVEVASAEALGSLKKAVFGKAMVEAVVEALAA